MPTMPMERVIETLSGVFLSYDVNARAGNASSFTLMEAVGAEVEIYKYSSFPLRVLMLKHQN